MSCITTTSTHTANTPGADNQTSSPSQDAVAQASGVGETAKDGVKRKSNKFKIWQKHPSKRDSQKDSSATTSPPKSTKKRTSFQSFKQKFRASKTPSSPADIQTGHHSTQSTSDSGTEAATGGVNTVGSCVGQSITTASAISSPLGGVRVLPPPVDGAAAPGTQPRITSARQFNSLPGRAQLASVPPPPTGNALLRSFIPVPSQAMDENIREELRQWCQEQRGSDQWRRDHVAYPHLHYPSSASRSAAAATASSAAAATSSSSSMMMASLAGSFRAQCSTSVPHYPGAGADRPASTGGGTLSTFGTWAAGAAATAAGSGSDDSISDGFIPLPTPHFTPFAGAVMTPRTEMTQVDYAHFLVPDLLEISRCGFYWGVMDRYEAERLLDNKPEGTFLLRDSAQEEFLFSVSFRRYGRSLHARIDQWHHRFSFDTHDSGVFSADSVTNLIEHYKDPSCCMFFEPMLTIPLNRNYPFSLQHLARATICKQSTYDGVNLLPLPKPLIEYLKYYHYKLMMNKRKVELPVQASTQQASH